MNERARKQGLFVVFALLALLSQAIAADSKKITLGQSSIGMSATGTWMAKEIGAFEKYGIQADLI
jgi:ABC-type nitrate/sulfonate/bicarbonate transport system substrate-binding protein